MKSVMSAEDMWAAGLRLGGISSPAIVIQRWGKMGRGMAPAHQSTETSASHNVWPDPLSQGLTPHAKHGHPGDGVHRAMVGKRVAMVDQI